MFSPLLLSASAWGFLALPGICQVRSCLRARDPGCLPDPSLGSWLPLGALCKCHLSAMRSSLIILLTGVCMCTLSHACTSDWPSLPPPPACSQIHTPSPQGQGMCLFPATVHPHHQGQSVTSRGSLQPVWGRASPPPQEGSELRRYLTENGTAWVRPEHRLWL